MADNRFTIKAVLKAVDNITAPIKRMQDSVLKFSRTSTRAIQRLNKNVIGVMKSFIGGAAKVAAVTAGLTLGVAAYGDATTSAAAESAALANAVGLEVRTMEALGAAVKSAGFGVENIVDLVEEMNNKLGESSSIEEMTAVTESLHTLGLAFKDIKKLAPEEQFKAITDADIKMTAVQQASFALDSLFGAEGSRIAGILSAQGLAVDDLIKKHEELTFRTAEGRAGALAYAKQAAQLKTTLGSLTAEFFGLLGAELAPYLAELTEKIRALDKAAVAEKVLGFAKNVSDFVKTLVSNRVEIGQWFTDVGKGITIVGGLVVALWSLSTVLTAVNLVMSLNPVGAIIIAVGLLSAAIALLIIKWDTFKEKFSGAGAFFESVSNVGTRFSRNVGGGLGGFGNGFAAPGGNLPTMSPHERASRNVEERNTNTSTKSEVTIRDETGRAEVTSGGGAGMSLISGGF
jgi:hypothetical protein